MPGDFTGCRVLILVGDHAGEEGVCVGRSGEKWAVTPDDSDEILQLTFESEFGLLMDGSGDPSAN